MHGQAGGTAKKTRRVKASHRQRLESARYGIRTPEKEAFHVKQQQTPCTCDELAVSHYGTAALCDECRNEDEALYNTKESETHGN